jgi:hypothetical protein
MPVPWQNNSGDISMSFDMIIGALLTMAALGAVVLLTLWSRSIIERIHQRAPGSLRDIQKDILNGNKS